MASAGKVPWSFFQQAVRVDCFDSILASCQSSIVYNLAKTSRKNTQPVSVAAVWDALQVTHPDSNLLCISHICSTMILVHTQLDVLSLCAVACAVQAQCQKDLKGLSKQIESKQADLEKAQVELQHQQNTEAAVQKRIGEAERRIQVCKDVGLGKKDF